MPDFGDVFADFNKSSHLPQSSESESDSHAESDADDVEVELQTDMKGAEGDGLLVAAQQTVESQHDNRQRAAMDKSQRLGSRLFMSHKEIPTKRCMDTAHHRHGSKAIAFCFMALVLLGAVGVFYLASALSSMWISATEAAAVSQVALLAGGWLENEVRQDPPVEGPDKDLYVTIGLSSQGDCSQIGEHAVLRLYVGPNTTETCQGWNVYADAFPNTSTAHANSAINVRCMDGGVSYTQIFGGLNCSGWVTQKQNYYQGCHQGMTQSVYAKLVDFSGCLKQGFSPNATTE